MNKIILAGVVTSLFLSACSTMPIDSAMPVQGTLKNTKEIGLNFQTEAVKPRVDFAVTGYTIIGVAYVAASVSTMNSHSEAMQTAYQKYLAAHPDALTLKDAFNNKLKQDLESRGINPQLVQVTKKADDNKHLSYAMDSGLKVQKVVVIDGLTSQYFAADNGSDYHPRSSVLVSIFDSNNNYAKPANQERVVNLEVSDYAYPNFDSLAANPDKSYIGLLTNVEKLADKVANELYQ
ncbi:hypothetical protein [Sulfuriferula nivalis]|uniref:Lipoprotein n=1 Tax=Sulfuriferula nivalis TaxID=2675298 RepID=A0A809RK14_9PROT|nr:hypothetical protein [Sulfuriferula nivalis]BBP01926.1 hypothetical protein SFSGTM_26340 [Sulfuriferula nivalis]